MRERTVTASDDPKVIAAAIILAVVGISFFMAMPVIVGAWSDYAGFTAQQAGLLAALDSGGGIAASVFLSLMVRRIDRRWLALFAILVAVLANIASSLNQPFDVLAVCRVFAGFGAGCLYALGLVTLATTQNTTRNYSILLFAQVSFGIVEISAFSWLAEQFGMNAIYYVMAIALAGTAALLRWIPRSSHPAMLSVQAAHSNSLIPWACLLAIFLFYSATGGFWAYIERIGNANGLSRAFVANTLAYTQVLSLLGCIAAAWMSRRLGEYRPLIASLLCVSLVNVGLSAGVGEVGYVITLCVFFFLWNAIDIYQLGTLSGMVGGERYVALVPALQSTAISAGPALAALLLTDAGSFAGILLLNGAITLLATLLMLFVYWWQSRPAAESAMAARLET